MFFSVCLEAWVPLSYTYFRCRGHVWIHTDTSTDVRCTSCATGPFNRQEILLGNSLGMLLSSHAKSSKLLSSIVSQLQLWHLNLTVSVTSVGANAVGVNNPCVTEALLQSSKRVIVWMNDVDQPKIVRIPLYVAGFVICVFYDHSITTEPSVQRVSCVNLPTCRIVAISAAEKGFNPSHGYSCLENQTSCATASTCF
jgi:hypothetical protein